MKQRIRFWRQFYLSILSQAISLISQVIVLSEVYRSSDLISINQALLLFSLGQSLTFLDFGSNAAVIRSSAFFHSTKDSTHLNEIVIIVRRLALISIVYLSILLLLYIYVDVIRIYLIYITFIISSNFLNLFINILRGFGSVTIATFTNSAPLLLVAIIAVLVDEGVYPQFFPISTIAFGCIYGLCAFLFFRNKFQVLDLGFKNMRLNLRSLISDALCGFKVSINFWIYQLCFVIFLNFDRFVTLSDNDQLRSYSPYIILFVGFMNLLWIASSNHTVMLIHDQFSENTKDKNNSKRLFRLGMVLAMSYPIISFFYVSQTLGVGEFSLGISLSFSLQIVLVSSLMNQMIYNSSSREISKNAKVYFILMSLHLISSQYLVDLIGVLGSPLAMNLSTLVVYLSLRAHQLLELKRVEFRAK